MNILKTIIIQIIYDVPGPFGLGVVIVGEVVTSMTILFLGFSPPLGRPVSSGDLY